MLREVFGERRLGTYARMRVIHPGNLRSLRQSNGRGKGSPVTLPLRLRVHVPAALVAVDDTAHFVPTFGDAAEHGLRTAVRVRRNCRFRQQLAVGRSKRELDGRPANVDSRDRYERTPLHIAAGSHELDCARLLLDAGANPNTKAGNGDTPLDAAWSDDAIEALLLSRGAKR